jgi:hypothetical protein
VAAEVFNRGGVKDRVSSFRTFVERYNQPPAGQAPLHTYEHVPRLIDVADRVVRGELRRVLILMPPRYFKSELFSRLLPAYYLHRHMTRNVGLASYSATLAWKLSGKAREYYQEAGGATAPDTDAKKEWATGEGGRMWADGVGGSITGSGFHLGIIDDPMKPVHVRSRAYIEAFRAWYPETWYNRQEPGAAMIVVMQRLGQSDPIDFLFRREVGDGMDAAPEHWHVVCCDEIKSAEPLGRYDGPRGLPGTCTLEPDDRPVGAVLSPSRFDEDEVRRQQRAAGVYNDAQRQQRPGKPSGDFWKEHWFGVYGTPAGDPRDELPSGAHRGGRDWDTAYTKNEANSASACIEAFREGRGERPKIYITDADWRWYEFPELVAWMKRSRGPHYIEAKASGKSARQTLVSYGIQAKEVKVEGGDKYARAAAAQPAVSTDDQDGTQVDAPRVLIHASLYQKVLFDEAQGLLAVTKEDLLDGSGGLDLNDCFVQMINRHTGRGKPAWGKP